MGYRGGQCIIDRYSTLIQQADEAYVIEIGFLSYRSHCLSGNASRDALRFEC